MSEQTDTPNGQLRWAFDTPVPTIEASKDGGQTWYPVGTFTGPPEALVWNPKPWPILTTKSQPTGAEG